jgi:hypothetical protein
MVQYKDTLKIQVDIDATCGCMPDKCNFLFLIASTKQPTLIMQFQITVHEIHMQIYTSWLNQNFKVQLFQEVIMQLPPHYKHTLVYREHRIIANLPKGEQKK